MSICSKFQLTCTFIDNYRIYTLLNLSDFLQCHYCLMMIICNFRSIKCMLSRVLYSKVYLVLLNNLAISLNKIRLQICSYFKTVVMFMLSEKNSKEKIKLSLSKFILQHLEYKIDINSGTKMKKDITFINKQKLEEGITLNYFFLSFMLEHVVQYKQLKVKLVLILYLMVSTPIFFITYPPKQSLDIQKNMSYHSTLFCERQRSYPLYIFKGHCL